MPDISSLFLSYDPTLDRRVENNVNPETRNAAQIIQDELNIYDSMAVELVADGKILSWWREKKDEIPLMCKLARFIHSIPASSAAAESTFSFAGLADADNRHNDPCTLEAILLLKCNKELVNDEIGEY